MMRNLVHYYLDSFTDNCRTKKYLLNVVFALAGRSHESNFISVLCKKCANAACIAYDLKSRDSQFSELFKDSFLLIFFTASQILDHEVKGSLSFEETKDGLEKMFDTPMIISFDDWERMTDGMALCNLFERIEEAQFHTMIRNELRTYIEASITKGMRVTSRGCYENAVISALRVLLIRMDPEALGDKHAKVCLRSASLRRSSAATLLEPAMGDCHSRSESPKERSLDILLEQLSGSDSPSTMYGRRVARATARAERFALPCSIGSPSFPNGAWLSGELASTESNCKPGIQSLCLVDNTSPVIISGLFGLLQQVRDEKTRQLQQLNDDNSTFREIQNMLLSVSAATAHDQTFSKAQKTQLHQDNSPSAAVSVNGSTSSSLFQGGHCLQKGGRCLGPNESEAAAETSMHLAREEAVACVTLSERPGAEIAVDICAENTACGTSSRMLDIVQTRPGVCVRLVLAVIYPSLKTLEIQVLDALREALCCPRYDQVSVRKLLRTSGETLVSVLWRPDEDKQELVELYLYDTQDVGALRCTGEQLAELFLQRLGDERTRLQLPWCNIREGRLISEFTGIG